MENSQVHNSQNPDNIQKYIKYEDLQENSISRNFYFFIAEPEFFHYLHNMKYIASRDKTKEDPEFEFL